MTRTTRAAEERVTEERVDEQLPEFVGHLYFPEDQIPNEVEYKWVRASVLGQPDRENLQRNMLEGWRFVPPDRHPDLVPPELPGESPEPFIRRGANVLMERKKSRCEAVRRAIAEENARVLRDVDHERVASLDGKNFVPTQEIVSRRETNGQFDDGL